MRPIDGDALKITLDTFATIVGFGGVYDRGQVMECIDAAPTVATDTNVLGKWNSVKDGLPKDEGDVLVYGVSPRGRKKVAIMNYLAFEADRPRWALDGIWTVLYWMPMPEPPEEVSGDEKTDNQAS